MDTVDWKWSTAARPHRTKFVLILERVASLSSHPLLRDISGEKFEALSLNSPMLILGKSWTPGTKGGLGLPSNGRFKPDDVKSIGCQNTSGREGFIVCTVFQPFPLAVHSAYLHFYILLLPSPSPTKAQCCPSLITRGSVLHGNCHSSNCWLSIVYVTWILHIFPIWEKGRKANRLASWDVVNPAWWKGA